MIAAHELGVTDQLHLRRTVVRMSAPNPDLLPDNPLSKIPTLILEDGTVLIDSGVICEFLDALAGGGQILPLSGKARWIELSRHALGTGLLDVLILWRNERDKPPAAQTSAWLQSFATKVDATLERFARDVQVIADGPLPLGQIALGCALSYMDFRFGDMDWRAKHPSLEAWHTAFQARPAAKATEIIDDA
jgi:glutathione S-transferase